MQDAFNISVINNLFVGSDDSDYVFDDNGRIDGTVHILNNIIVRSNNNASVSIGGIITNTTFVNNIIEGGLLMLSKGLMKESY